jgi:hypothetical protein
LFARVLELPSADAALTLLMAPPSTAPSQAKSVIANSSFRIVRRATAQSKAGIDNGWAEYIYSFSMSLVRLAS